MMPNNQRMPVGGARRHAREFALLGIYQSMIDPEADYASIDANLLSVITDDGEPINGSELSVEDFQNCDQEFYREILEGVLSERDIIMEALAKHLERDPARLSVIERACMMIGTWELMHRMENPYRVVINEAVELSKHFGADRGYRLVNGVLDKVAADVRPAEVKAE